MFEKEAEEWTIDYVCKDCSRYKECKSKEHCTCKECSKEKWQKGAEFGYNKAVKEMYENGLALQSDMDKTIEQNFALKTQVEKMRVLINQYYEVCAQIPKELRTMFFDSCLEDTRKMVEIINYKFRCLTPEELMKYFRDKTLFYPVGFSSNEQFSFMIETIEIDHKTDNAEVELISLYLAKDNYPICHRANQLELLRNWRFADGLPCGVKCENGIEILEVSE